jgi:hypothetical protein
MLTEIEPYTDVDGVRPARDTGFRMKPVPEFKYTRRVEKVDTRPYVDYLHNDDLHDVGNATLRGQPLEGVRVYEVDYASAERRIIRDIRCNVIRSQGDSPCLCDLPGTVPCTDCGAGL